MAEKIKKSIPWILFVVLAGLIVGVGFASFCPLRVSEVKADAATSTVTPTVKVGNALPSIDAVSLTPSPNITLTENTTTTATCTVTVIDQNGGDTISSATATVYLATAGSSCESEDNDCYRYPDEITLYATSSVDEYYYATWTVDIWHHAEPGEWTCYVIAEDNQGAATSSTDTATVATTNALIITSSIDYETLGQGATSSDHSTTTATTTGNAAIDIKIKGTDMTTSTLVIPGGQQQFSTTSFSWESSPVGAQALSTTTFETLQINLPKPYSHDSSNTSTADILWKIGIPSGQDPGTYSGTTWVAATTDT